MRAKAIGSKAGLAAVVIGGLAVSVLGGAAHAAAPVLPTATSATRTVSFNGAGFTKHAGPNGEVDVNACSTAIAAGTAHCNARVRIDDGVVATAAAAAGPLTVSHPGQDNGPYDPAYLQSAYNAPSSTGGTGKTVAVVDAYDNPNAESDLATYRSNYGLPPCTTANGCFRKLNQDGNAAPLPPGDSGWGIEISLDLDMVSAMCPNCHILLVEANDTYYSSLGSAVNTAVAQGATAVSNSYGGGEFSSEATYASQYYDHPGIPITVSSGDDGYGVAFPAAAPNVIAVGGTALHQTGHNGTRNATETVWNNNIGAPGSGCSQYVTKQSWQTDACSKRTVADVSADADPVTGAWVYDTYGYGGFNQVGGTSESAPIIAGLFALAGPATTQPARYVYSHSANFNDVTSGNDGSCGGSYLCTAKPGYDGPTGIGTPNGVTGLGQNGAAGSDFNASIAPSTLTLAHNTSSAATVNVAPLNGFTGSVHLSAAVSPSTGLGATLTSASVNVGPATGSTSLNLNATVPGTYAVTVTATAGAISHQTTLNVTVTGPHFTMKGPKSGKTVKAGKTTSVKISVKAFEGFTGPVTFTLTGLPAGATYTLTKPVVNGHGSETFKIVTTTALPIGVPFALTFTGTSGLLAQSVPLTLTLK